LRGPGRRTGRLPPQAKHARSGAGGAFGKTDGFAEQIISETVSIEMAETIKPRSIGRISEIFKCKRHLLAEHIEPLSRL
jgi:hypothetical protein